VGISLGNSGDEKTEDVVSKKRKSSSLETSSLESPSVLGGSVAKLMASTKEPEVEGMMMLPPPPPTWHLSFFISSIGIVSFFMQGNH
jgi:hypothetical protein